MAELNDILCDREEPGKQMEMQCLASHLLNQYSVRAITADFGFSFALPCPPSIAQQLDLPAEPPAKRRRTNETTSPERHSNVTPEKIEKKASSRSAEAEAQPDPTRLKVRDHNCAALVIPEENSTTTTGATSTEQAPKAIKKAPKARRKLCLDDIVEHLEAQPNDREVRTGGLEDTFIFGFTPRKRQPKSASEEGAAAVEPKQKKKAAPRVKKTTKAKKQLEDKLEVDQDAEPAAQIGGPEKKSKTTRKKATASKYTGTIATIVEDSIKSPIDNGVKHGPDDSPKLLPATDVMSDEAVKAERRAVSTTTAPKRAPKRSIDETATAVETMNTATPEKPTKRPRRQAAISATKKVAMGYEDELIPVDKLRRAPGIEGTARKSRKCDVLGSSANALLSPPLTAQADLVAKDIQNYDANGSPSPPRVVATRGRKPGSKTAKERACKADEQPEVVEHLLVEHAPLSPKLPAKKGRKPGVKAAKGRTCATEETQKAIRPQQAEHLSPAKDNSRASDNEEPLAPKLPAKRGRKPGSKNRKIIAATKDEEPTGAPDITEPVSNHLSSAQKDDYAPGDGPTLAPKLPTKRGRKPGFKNRKVMTIPVEPIATEPGPKGMTSTLMRSELSIDTRSEPQATRTIHSVRKGRTGRLQETSADERSAGTSQEASERSRPLAKQSSRESSRKNMDEQPAKQRRALADFDGNIVRKSLTVEGKKLVPSAIDSASVSRMQQSKPRKTVKELALQPDTRVDTIRAGKAQLLPQLECSSNEGPSHETTTSPKRRRVILADEDVDWLFEEPESRRPKPATSRQPAAKTRRKAAVQSANDIDVDDLVATVDGLAAGELLTGRRGCVVAS